MRFSQGRQGIGQETEALHGQAPAGLGNGRSAVLGRVVVHQHGKGPRRADKAAKQDVAGCHYRISLEDMAGTGVGQLQAGTPVKQRHIYSTGIRRIKMHRPVVQLAQRRSLQQTPEYKGVFHFGKAYYIRQAPFGRSGPENPFGNSVALGVEALFGPAPLSPGGEFGVGDRCGVVPVIKEVFQVPEHYPERIVLRPRNKQQAGQ